jgi:hypothetical protein
MNLRLWSALKAGAAPINQSSRAAWAETESVSLSAGASRVWDCAVACVGGIPWSTDRPRIMAADPKYTKVPYFRSAPPSASCNSRRSPAGAKQAQPPAPSKTHRQRPFYFCPLNGCLLNADRLSAAFAPQRAPNSPMEDWRKRGMVRQRQPSPMEPNALLIKSAP